MKEDSRGICRVRVASVGVAQTKEKESDGEDSACSLYVTRASQHQREPEAIVNSRCSSDGQGGQPSSLSLLGFEAIETLRVPGWLCIVPWPRESNSAPNQA